MSSHLGCARGKQVRGNVVVWSGNNLRDGVTNSSRTAGAVAVSSVTCADLSNANNVNGVGKAL